MSGTIGKMTKMGLVEKFADAEVKRKAKEQAEATARRSEAERIEGQNALNQQAGAAIENQAATARARRRGLLGGVSVTGGEQTLGSGTYL